MINSGRLSHNTIPSPSRLPRWLTAAALAALGISYVVIAADSGRSPRGAPGQATPNRPTATPAILPEHLSALALAGIAEITDHDLEAGDAVWMEDGDLTCIGADGKPFTIRNAIYVAYKDTAGVGYIPRGAGPHTVFVNRKHPGDPTNPDTAACELAASPDDSVPAGTIRMVGLRSGDTTDDPWVAIDLSTGQPLTGISGAALAAAELLSQYSAEHN